MKKIAVVTGATGGIGTEICVELSSLGYTVVAIHRPGKEQQAQEWLEGIEGRINNKFFLYPIDVSSFTSCEAALKSIVAEIGTPSVLVNNAGITADATLRKLTVEDWDTVINTNLNSVFNMSKCVFQGMCDMSWGRIVNISSINGQKGQFGQVNYSAAKAGIYGITKALAQEGARKGVTVNSISPGYIETSMIMKLKPEVREAIKSDIPVGRFGKPIEIAKAVGYLVGDYSGFVTGSNLSINGGQHMY